MVTHVDVSDDGVDVALEAWASVAGRRVPGAARVRRRNDGPVHEELSARDRPRIPPGQRLVKTWPVLHYGPIPTFDGAHWDLEVSGLVANPFTLSYEELRALPSVTVGADMHCVTGWTTLDNSWEGCRSARSSNARSRRQRRSG